jgi:GTP diphosphokinase / guanosine-3',5'-bis(diphosphate) 3'-diphosphatase
VPDLGESTGLLIKAIKFSAERHRKQRRKDASATAYINHPIQVMELLWFTGEIRDRDVLIAALLHDTVEDTVRPTSAEEASLKKEIEDLFGTEVLQMVLEVTDDKTKDHSVRKQLQVDHAKTLSYGAKLIKLADKTCNVKDISENPPVFWSRARKTNYLDWAEQVVDGLRGVHPVLEGKFDEVIRQGRLKLA